MSEEEFAPARVVCDRCRASFDVDLSVETADDGSETLYFACPECGRVFLIAVATAEGVRLREKLAKLRDQGRQGTGKYEKVLRRYQAQIRRIPPEEQGLPPG